MHTYRRMEIDRNRYHVTQFIGFPIQLLHLWRWWRRVLICTHVDGAPHQAGRPTEVQIDVEITPGIAVGLVASGINGRTSRHRTIIPTYRVCKQWISLRQVPLQTCDNVMPAVGFIYLP